MKVPSIIAKNFLILLHSKLSSLVLIFGPIFLILIIGLGVGGDSLREVQVNMYTPAPSNFTENFATLLQKNNFVVSKTYSQGDCISGVRDSDKIVCIILDKYDPNLPVNLSQSEIEALKNYGFGYTTVIYADFSKQRTVWNVVGVVERVVYAFSSELRGGAGVKLKESLQESKIEISQKREKIGRVITLLEGLDSKIAFSKQSIAQVNLEVKMDQIISDLESAIFVLDSGITYVNSTYPGSADGHLSTSALNSILISLKETRSNADSISSQKLLSDLNSFQSDVQTAIKDLNETDNELKSVQENIDRASQLDFNYILNPIPISYHSASEGSESIQESLEFIDYLFPSFLSFFIVLVSVVLSTILVIKERVSDAYVRNSASKTAGITFILGTFLTVLLIVLFQCFCILGIASFFLNIPLLSNFLSLFVVILFSVSVFSMLGMLIGYLFNSQETAIIASISVILFFIIFSPLINPLETTHPFVRGFLSYTPLVLTETITRKLLIFGSGLQYSLASLAALCLTFTTLFVIANLVYSMTKSKEIK